MKSAQSRVLTLEEVAEHFEQWRSHKKQGERIPQRLWSEAIGLLCDYPISRVLSTLGLCGTDLKKHQAQLNDTQSTPDAGSGMAFMELEASLIEPTNLRPVEASLVIELQRPDGLRLRVESANTSDLVVLAERFMGV
jgi:hypothetical protein